MTEPKTISELMKLVMEECKKGNINNAIIYLNEAIEIDPHDARFYISRGTFKETENYEDAIEDYTKAIETELVVCRVTRESFTRSVHKQEAAGIPCFGPLDVRELCVATL